MNTNSVIRKESDWVKMLISERVESQEAELGYQSLKIADTVKAIM